MFFYGLLLISFYFCIFILPFVGIILGIIGLKNKISKEKNDYKKRNNRFCIYGIISILFIILLIFFPINTILSLKYSKTESLLNYFEKNFEDFENCSFGNMPNAEEISWCVVLEKKEYHMKNMTDV